MFLFISIPLILLALVAGMYLLAKAKAEALGSFFVWISYLIITVALLLLICELTRGVARMACHGKGYYRECGMGERCGGGYGMGCCMDYKRGYHGRGEMKEGCCMEGEDEQGKMGCHGEDDEETEEKADSPVVQ